MTDCPAEMAGRSVMYAALPMLTGFRRDDTGTNFHHANRKRRGSAARRRYRLPPHDPWLDRAFGSFDPLPEYPAPLIVESRAKTPAPVVALAAVRLGRPGAGTSLRPAVRSTGAVAAHGS